MIWHYSCFETDKIRYTGTWEIHIVTAAGKLYFLQSLEMALIIIFWEKSFVSVRLVFCRSCLLVRNLTSPLAFFKIGLYFENIDNMSQTVHPMFKGCVRLHGTETVPCGLSVEDRTSHV